ncbi:MAG: aromatic ring-hydroxylating dioxygenase subunit alpha [Spongiibacteraceae bacterium]|jgi:vanillate O-demethylase monooxygenase subunit|nr:aromatic ring-hydroxylating dioxygenase subunit alpha [Spongiibacteraceae bacterium]
MAFLRNVWYPATWASEVRHGELFERTLLNESIVFYRTAAGEPVALQNRCPHRFAPLSMGKQKGDAVQCPYHGLEFGASGACVYNPHGDGKIPAAARVHSYPLAERYRLLWIWMGDPARADVSLIPPFPFLDPETHYAGEGYLHVKSNYVLETDNILDLSHIQFLHPFFASEQVAKADLEMVQEGNTVWSKRLVRNEELSPFMQEAFGLGPEVRVDRWLDTRWDAPASMSLVIGVVPTGGRARIDGKETETWSAHLFAPETDTTTHYLFSFGFPKAAGPHMEEAALKATSDVRGPFEQEDLPMLEAVQKAMGDADFWRLKPVLLPGDAPAIRARRVLDKLIEQEREGVS